ncbi:hypothetical protein BHE74_00028404 [Ensete ventricosum]|nr:hypothetical protein GW17_00046210 [Ensete ventricosum]RWW64356.1 hypothetical protein BHE74_00028404 [Ensete ventricosum]RZS12089.1 hypothetical protein BHM03_00043477 [Ensete ventricosum]
MERHDHTLTSTRVHVLDLCPRKALCLRSMSYFICRLPSCGLDTSPSSTQVTLLLDLHELTVALMPIIPRVSPSLSLISTSTLNVSSYDIAMVAPPLDLVIYPPMHYFIQDHAMTPRCSLGLLSFVEILS